MFLPQFPPPGKGYPAVLLIHGGAWSSMDRSAVEGIALFLCREGFAVFNIDYRLAPGDPWPRGFEDCQKGFAYLQQTAADSFGLDREALFVAGGSAGGHYALLTGLTAPEGSVAGIVSISGIAEVFSDFRHAPGRYGALLGKEPGEEELKQLDAAGYYYKGAPPVLCTHFLRDQVVPLESAQNFADHIRKEGGEVSVYFYDFERDGQGHAIWIPGTTPRRLFPDLEEQILIFLRSILSRS